MNGSQKKGRQRNVFRRRATRLFMLLLVMTAGMGACRGSVAGEAPAADPATITLEPFTSDQLGISGLAPAGWVEVKPGQFRRMPDSDPTLLLQAALPGATGESVAAGWHLPERSGSVETANRTWELYSCDLEVPGAGTLALAVALAEFDGGVYFVALATAADEQETLHAAIMEPVLQALGPAPATADEIRVPAVPEAAQEKGPQPLATRRRPADGMTMVYVPAGEFQMGNAGTQWMWSGTLAAGDLTLQVFVDEGPQHAVTLDAFWIDQTEVTVAMFRTFVEATGYETSAERDGWGAPYRAGPKEDEWPHIGGVDWQHPHGPASQAQADHPVVQVSWGDAAAYCAWAGGQLPTEAQWEKAARGTDGRRWPWGDVYDGSRGSFCGTHCPCERQQQRSYGDGFALTAPVGSFPGGASPYGALDMAGNVWEWTADWYDEATYAASPYEHPTGPPSGSERVQRGGAWIDNEAWVRTTVRHATEPGVRCDDLGFRCAVAAVGADAAD